MLFSFMGGSNRKKLNKSSRRAPCCPSSYSSSHHGLFVEGGALSDCSAFNSPPSRGKKGNIGGTGSSKPDSKWGARGHPSGSRGNAIGYAYPTEDTRLPEVVNQANEVGTSTHVVLIDSEKTPTVDNGAIGEFRSVEYICDYTASLTMDRSSHRGLGFYKYAETTQNDFDSAFKIEERDGDSIVFSSCGAIHLGGDTDLVHGTKAKIGEDPLEEMTSPEENPRYLIIGGTKIYTNDTEEEEQELTDVESSEEDDDDEDDDEDCSATSGSEELSSVTDSDIDEEVAVDYFEGIGGIVDIVNVDQLVGKVSEVSEDDSDSKDSFDETLQKFGGMELMEASRGYGQMKPGSGIKHLAKNKKLKPIKYAGSPTLDGLMLVKDPRTSSGRKKNHDKISQSWPSESQKNKKFWNIPGEKKKHRRESIAEKRRDRMINHGVDLQQINSKLQQMVLDDVDILSFQPMQSRDCSQIRRLASLYRLGSLCSGSGKKRFVTVTRTHHTCMPCSMDEVRLEKLIGADKDDADYPVVETMTAQFHRDNAKKSIAVGASTSNGSQPSRARSNKQSRNKKVTRKVGSYASQPLSFVSSGIMSFEAVDSEDISPLTKDVSPETKNAVSNSLEVGAFEMHTTGFGSKMLAKMGFLEGGGLGKDGQGVSHPIEVVQRPKSLGLGAEIPETSTNSVDIHASPKPTSSSIKSSNANDKLAKKDHQKLGSFEKHTKGFGSKMMTKMGFVEGTGLGKDSQGMVDDDEDGFRGRHGSGQGFSRHGEPFSRCQAAKGKGTRNHGLSYFHPSGL